VVAHEIERAVEREFRPRIRHELELRLRQRAAEVDARRPVHCPQCQHAMKLKKRNCFRSLCSLWGPIRLGRNHFECMRCHVSRFPADEQLGLPRHARWTPLVAARILTFTVVMTFAQAARLLRTLWETSITAQGAGKVTQRIGEQLRARKEAQSDPDESPHAATQFAARGAGKQIQLAMDGSFVMMRSGEGGPSRTAEGDDPLDQTRARCRGREVKVATISVPGRRGKSLAMVRQTMVGVLGSADDLLQRLFGALRSQRLVGPRTRVAVIGDGARWIWERATMFPNRVEILDFWHATEHAWACARALWGDGTARTSRWAHDVRRRLRKGEVKGVLAHLRRQRKQLAKRRIAKAALEAMDGRISYYETHATGSWA
jgi:hypothetical protein